MDINKIAFMRLLDLVPKNPEPKILKPKTPEHDSSPVIKIYLLFLHQLVNSVL